MITKNMVRHGVLSGVISIEDHPVRGGVICRIAKSGLWYWLGEEVLSSSEYLATTGMNGVIDEIYGVIIEAPGDETEKCVEALREEGITDNRIPFVVEITETYRKSVIVYAHDSREAYSLAEGLCNSGKIDLERNCYDGREIRPRKANADETDAYDVYCDNISYSGEALRALNECGGSLNYYAHYLPLLRAINRLADYEDGRIDISSGMEDESGY